MKRVTVYFTKDEWAKLAKKAREHGYNLDYDSTTLRLALGFTEEPIREES